MPATRVLLLATALLFSAVSDAKDVTDKAQISREQAAALAQQRYPGKIVKVQTEQQRYRIRVLQADGRVVTVLVDGQSGRVQRDGN
ncbi:PepSY domain-containing protein [Rheinheimera sp. YQF-2]|uniref:PepSY domain-containing protein n=1 Tax=Rheinheimera lutimaris TaxID=2740584 RepID=A0A7Y5AP58_9GAMM|nr:PepSY domain-containing protein [Rheinheimera lutimaris]NRQ41988.1 PepSY domain-containing protein [Rheinheimera lutimaris]